MKVTLSLSKIIFVTLCGITIYLFIRWRGAQSDNDNANSQLEDIRKAQFQQAEDHKAVLRKDSIKYVKAIDSAKRVFDALESKRKSDNSYYQNKVNALKKVNTYTRRQSYSDSLARAIVR